MNNLSHFFPRAVINLPSDRFAVFAEWYRFKRNTSTWKSKLRTRSLNARANSAQKLHGLFFHRISLSEIYIFFAWVLELRCCMSIILLDVACGTYACLSGIKSYLKLEATAQS